MIYVVPSPSETWFWGMSEGGSSAKTASWLHLLRVSPALHRLSRDAASWLSSALQFGALREVVARERQGALSCHVASRKAW